MIGAMVDQRVLEELASQYFPKLYDHFEKLQFKVALVALPGFLTLFINYTPLEVRHCNTLYYFLLTKTCRQR